MAQEIGAGNIWFGPEGDNVPRVKKFLRDSQDKGLTPETIWPALEVGTNDDAKKALLDLLPDVPVFDNPKPESLIERVIHIATNPGDLVLDSFAGSGTTGAVAHKMGRRWIMIELGEHCHTHIIPRLRKVIDGEDKGGITEAVGWQGGGGFRYYRLAPSLLEKDRWGNWVISKDYNAAMLAEAMCRHMGFTYAPSQDPAEYWRHGHSSERDFIFVTTASLTHDQLKAIALDVGPDRTLLICCKAFNARADAFENLTVKKIPQAVLSRCEWGRDDYSLHVATPPDEPETAATIEPQSPKAKRGKRQSAGPSPAPWLAPLEAKSETP
jgi:adenine-specific DNA-methyltransferase